MNTTYAKIILDSVIDGVRVTTFELCFPRFILAQFGTHRSFSRNSASSRAIPRKKILQMCDFEFDVWRQNGKGMQPHANLGPVKSWLAARVWSMDYYSARFFSWLLFLLGAHKEIVNRCLEPYMYIKVIATSSPSGLQNFFKLRCHESAEREIQVLADAMLTAYVESKPVQRDIHLPFFEGYGNDPLGDKLRLTMKKANVDFIVAALRSSTARCARVSYLNHYGVYDSEDETRLYNDLVNSTPQHFSPTEHPVMSQKMFGYLLGLVPEWEHRNAMLQVADRDKLCGNLQSPVVQYRKVLEILS